VANLITGNGRLMQMSNGLSVAVLHVLVMSGSAMATRADERRFVRWLAEDIEPSSRGVGGFDILELPWSTVAFEEERSFMLRVVEDALTTGRWSLLPYEPKRDWVVDRLDQLRTILADMTQPLGRPGADGDVVDDAKSCAVHGALLVEGSCVICDFRATLVT
jgi:hypothetical protein